MKKFAVCFAVLAIFSSTVILSGGTRVQAQGAAPSPNDLGLRGPVPTGSDRVPTPSTPTTPTSSPSGDSLNLRGNIPEGATFEPEMVGPLRTIGASDATNTKMLQGSAYQIKVSARNLDKSPLTRNRDANLKYVEMTVKNDGPNIAVILGNACHASVGGEDLPAAPPSASEDSDRPQLSGKGNLVVWAATLPTLGIAGPMTYELLTPEEHFKRSLGTAIGRDGSRQEVEATHFGVRVIMPGDQTVGWLAFPCPGSRQVKNLVVPISFTRSKIGAGSITVPVAQTASK